MFKIWTKADVILDNFYTTDKKKWYVVKDIRVDGVTLGGLEVSYEELSAHWYHSPDACSDIESCRFNETGWYMVEFVESGIAGRTRVGVWWYNGDRVWCRSIGEDLMPSKIKPSRVIGEMKPC